MFSLNKNQTQYRTPVQNPKGGTSDFTQNSWGVHSFFKLNFKGGTLVWIILHFDKQVY